MTEIEDFVSGTVSIQRDPWLAAAVIDRHSEVEDVIKRPKIQEALIKFVESLKEQPFIVRSLSNIAAQEREREIKWRESNPRRIFPGIARLLKIAAKSCRFQREYSGGNEYSRRLMEYYEQKALTYAWMLRGMEMREEIERRKELGGEEKPLGEVFEELLNELKDRWGVSLHIPPNLASLESIFNEYVELLRKRKMVTEKATPSFSLEETLGYLAQKNKIDGEPNLALQALVLGYIISIPDPTRRANGFFAFLIDPSSKLPLIGRKDTEGVIKRIMRRSPEETRYHSGLLEEIKEFISFLESRESNQGRENPFRNLTLQESDKFSIE